MTRTASKKKTSKKKKRSSKRSNKTVDKKQEEATPSVAVDDAAFAAAIKGMFSAEEREDIIKEYNLMQSCKQAHKDIITAAEALGLLDEFKDCAFAISHDGRFFPIEQSVFDEEYDEYEGDDEDEDGEEDEYNATTIIRDLKRYMKKQDINQTEMAEKLGCSQAAVSTWLRDESHPRQKYCAQIAKIIYDE